MVSIRLQRTGRRHHAHFRVVVQDSRQAPTSGRVIAILGFYDPHTKESRIDVDKATTYLENGAQPSARVIKLLVEQKAKLPDWVKPPPPRSDKIRHPDKLRRNQPAEAKAPAKDEVAKESPAAEADPPAEESPQSDQSEEKTPAAEDKKAAEKTDSQGEEAVEENQAPAAETAAAGEDDPVKNKDA